MSSAGGVTSSCSSEIDVIKCDSFYCDERTRESSVGMCQDCTDTQRCFAPDSTAISDSTQPTCLTWQENRCPGGFVVPDFTQPNRHLNIVYQNGITVFHPNDVVIYRLDVFVDDITGADEQVLLFEQADDVTDALRIGGIISSAQAGGVLVRVTHLLPVEDHFIVVFGQPVLITDVIRQANIRDVDVNVTNVDDVITYDIQPADFLVDANQNFPNDVTVHDLNAHDVYKCVGHEYTDASGRRVFSQYAVVAVGDGVTLSNIMVGDVIVSDNSEGFLEQVDDVTTNSYGTFLRTNLAQCSESMTGDVNVDATRADVTGAGGDNWLGVLYYQPEVELTSSVSEHVVGRRAGGVFASVIQTFERDGFVYLEFIEVTAVTRDAVVTSADVTSLTPSMEESVMSAQLQHTGSETIARSVNVRKPYENIIKQF